MAATELCSGNCGGDPMSPRISFSHDFSHSSDIPIEQHPLRSKSSGLSNPTIDFDFCVRESFDHESSSADELFSDGRILPTEIKKKKKGNSNNIPLKQRDQLLLPSHPPSLPPQAVRDNALTTRTASKKEGKCVNNNIEEADEKQGHNYRSFWGFKRSSSCGSGYRRSLCPLPLLSRSYSTGSTASTGKRNMSLSKEGKNAQKLHASSARSSSSQYSFGPNTYQKPPLKKCQGSYGNMGGVGINPVLLNVPSANLFGFGSIFSKNRDKAKRK